jgi:molybdopterin molybdotransferase
VLISIEEGRRRVLDAARPLAAEPVALADARGRVLAEDVTSTIDVPPFDSSAMDGYALVAGPERQLELAGESRAGHPHEGELAEGTAVRISTGAAVPRGATAVIPVERTSEANGRVQVEETVEGANVRRAGEDMRAGEVVLSRGTPLGPAELGVAASVGRAEVDCARRPRVTLLVTGDELVQPGDQLGPGQIYSSNGFALAGLIAAAGAELVGRETVPDTAAGTHAALERALSGADVVIASGGVSVGPHDHVRPAFEAAGVEEVFWRVRIKPGKPLWFGRRGATLVFGLPGNPLSTIVGFAVFIEPALRRLQGEGGARPRLEAGRLTVPARASDGRTTFLTAALRPGADGVLEVTPTERQGSHMTGALGESDGFAVAPDEAGELPAGAPVDVLRLG